MFVTVAIAIPSAKTFTYAVPASLLADVAVGKRVLVPFGRKRLTGFILSVQPETLCTQDLKEILALLDADPLFGPDDLPFYEWVSRYYLHPLGKTLGEVLPGALAVKSHRWWRLAESDLPADRDAPPEQDQIVACLARHPAGLPIHRLRQLTARTDLARDLRRLEAAGIVIAEERLNRAPPRSKGEKWVCLDPKAPRDGRLTPRQAAFIAFLKGRGETRIGDLPPLLNNPLAALRTLARRGFVRILERDRLTPMSETEPFRGNGNPIILNPRQAAVLDDIGQCLATGLYSPCLLQGVTGSGKTEVYLRAIEKVLQGQGGALYLVPEIALTTQLLARISGRFPESMIAVLHSGIAAGARFEHWKRIRRGEIRLVVGARSALFAPVQNLRLIIVDEEHDPSYKQDDRLRYNARDLALVRGRYAQATVILGSATPAIQSRFQAEQGRYRYLTLPDRIDDRPLPTVEVIDLRLARDEQGRTPVLSSPLVTALRETLAQGKQSLLFLNRRGFHTYLFCPDCGQAFTCPSCDLALTHHAAENLLKCHHCDYRRKPDAHCPACRGNRVRSYGTGTERVEEEIRRLFPEARIARLDSDTTARRGSLDAILRRLERREIDILVGTQMITKGHDYPHITLVGVVTADASLNIADFRAAERTFQILTQVAGRSGRGDTPGRVIVQTFNPNHYALLRAQQHDFDGFYADELLLRQELTYPPFSRIVGIHFSLGKREEGKLAVARMGRRARELAASLTAEKIEVIGPAESPLARIRGRYRWQLLLKGKQSGPLHRLADRIAQEADGGLRVQIDVDPINFM